MHDHPGGLGCKLQDLLKPYFILMVKQVTKANPDSRGKDH